MFVSIRMRNNQNTTQQLIQYFICHVILFYSSNMLIVIIAVLSKLSLKFSLFSNSITCAPRLRHVERYCQGSSHWFKIENRQAAWLAWNEMDFLIYNTVNYWLNIVYYYIWRGSDLFVELERLKSWVLLSSLPPSYITMYCTCIEIALLALQSACVIDIK